MAIADTLLSREAVRRAALADLVARCEMNSVPMEGGPLDGIQVVTMGRIRDEMSAALLIDLPAPSDKYAEVVTPANVSVAAVCPECRLPMTFIVKLAPQLTVTNDGSELAVKAKSKARAHVCGQLELPVDESQQDFGLDDIAGAVPTIEVLETALLLVLPDELCKAVPSTVEMEGWSDLVKREVAEWAVAVHLVASDNDDVDIPARPEVIGGPPREDGEADGGTPAEPDPDAPAGDGGEAPTAIDSKRSTSKARGSAQAAARPATVTADDRIGELLCRGSNHVPGHTEGCPMFGRD